MMNHLKDLLLKKKKKNSNGGDPEPPLLERDRAKEFVLEEDIPEEEIWEEEVEEEGAALEDLMQSAEDLRKKRNTGVPSAPPAPCCKDRGDR